MAEDSILSKVLSQGGFNGPEILKKANEPSIKAKLREATAEAKEVGICGAPSYRVFKQTDSGDWKNMGGIIWGQDETNVLEDLIAGWDDENSTLLAEPRKAETESTRANAKL